MPTTLLTVPATAPPRTTSVLLAFALGVTGLVCSGCDDESCLETDGGLAAIDAAPDIMRSIVLGPNEYEIAMDVGGFGWHRYSLTEGGTLGRYDRTCGTISQQQASELTDILNHADVFARLGFRQRGCRDCAFLHLRVDVVGGPYAGTRAWLDHETLDGSHCRWDRPLVDLIDKLQTIVDQACVGEVHGTCH